MKDLEETCRNCRFMRSGGSYSVGTCRSPDLVIFSKESARKGHPRLQDVEPSDGQRCPYFKISAIGRLAHLAYRLRYRYYRWRHPEWFL